MFSAPDASIDPVDDAPYAGAVQLTLNVTAGSVCPEGWDELATTLVSNYYY